MGDSDDWLLTPDELPLVGEPELLALGDDDVGEDDALLPLDAEETLLELDEHDDEDDELHGLDELLPVELPCDELLLDGLLLEELLLEDELELLELGELDDDKLLLLDTDEVDDELCSLELLRELDEEPRLLDDDFELLDATGEEELGCCEEDEYGGLVLLDMILSFQRSEV